MQRSLVMWRIVIFVIFSFTWVLTCSQYYGDDDIIDDLEKNSTCFHNISKATQAFHYGGNLSSLECYWVFNSINKTGKINIFFHLLLLHEDDIVTLHRSFSEAQNMSSPLLSPIGAQNGSVTVITEEPTVVVKLSGNNTVFMRKFEGMMQSQACAFPLTADIQFIHSPIHTNLSSSTAECSYTYNKDPHFRRIGAFVFEKHNFSYSKVEIEGGTFSGFTNEFFPNEGKTMSIKVTIKVGSHEYFLLRQHFVDSSCSGLKVIQGVYPVSLVSPPYILKNDSITTECRWVVQHLDKSKILGIAFQNIDFSSVFDMVAINDGANEFATPLLQVTTSNHNQSMNQFVRTTGPYMWISFKPTSYASLFLANVTVHNNGGYHKGSGEISLNGNAGNDTIFLLEVDENQVVMLNFTTAAFSAPSTLRIYNDFFGSNLLTSLHGNVFYPVLSRSSRMMVIATNFISGNFVAKFHGVVPGCLHMSTLESENYILSGNCNSTCLWIIPPQDTPNSVLVLDLQYVSLEKGDQIEIFQLDSSRTHLGTVTTGVLHVPQMAIQANVGAIVEITRGVCEKEKTDIVLIGHSSYVPDCGQTLTPVPSETFQITSPRYPDTYPLLSKCHWNITSAKGNLIHLAFGSLKLAPNHCVTITQLSDKKSFKYYGHELQDDLLLIGDVTVEFDSSHCNKTQQNITGALISDEGFLLNGTIADCGALLIGKINGEFNTSTVNNKTLCIWKISVPPTTSDDINTILYSVTKTDDKQNYELHVYDGSSVRNPEILNNSHSDIWSRTNNLIFVYKRLDVSKSSSVLVIRYNTISCNKTMQCENKICMHPDWRCNGINECGDFTDERNCASVPIPPEVKMIGYSALAFWLTIVAMILFGAVLGVAVPYFYQRYKNGQYRRFGDISVIE